MKDYTQIIEEAIEESLALKKGLLDVKDKILEVARMVVETVKSGGKILIFGNGGSFSDAQHISAEMINKLKMVRPPIPAIALGTNPSILTSISNDSSFREVFEREVRALAIEKDLVIAISTSASSENVIRALEAARNIGAKRVGFTGHQGFSPELVDISIEVPSRSVQRIQETHILIGHIISEIVEKELFMG